jgi:hypothetical protein
MPGTSPAYFPYPVGKEKGKSTFSTLLYRRVMVLICYRYLCKDVDYFLRIVLLFFIIICVEKTNRYRYQ